MQAGGRDRLHAAENQGHAHFVRVNLIDTVSPADEQAAGDSGGHAAVAEAAGDELFHPVLAAAQHFLEIGRSTLATRRGSPTPGTLAAATAAAAAAAPWAAAAPP